MPVVIGIRFKDSGKIYYFDPGEQELRPGEHVIVETVRGLELAKVAYERREVPESEVIGELKPVVRRAEPVDLERLQSLHARHDEVLARCAEKVREHNLPMSLVKAEYSFDGSRLTFYFTAEKRVDFRMLVRDLARTFRSRIELRQIGPRDEAKLLGGIGPCGRVLCCASFLPDYARVSIKMAKDQDLPLNPSKISGVCGRLLCCLSYEHEQYVEMRAELPRRGTWVQTPDGPGEVVGQHVLKQQLTVQLATSGMQEIYALDKIEVATAQVAALARSRAAEGITPAPPPPRREPKDRGERRKLRDEIEQYDQLDELDLLEEPGAPAVQSPPPDAPRPQQAPEQPHPPSPRERGGAKRRGEGGAYQTGGQRPQQAPPRQAPPPPRPIPDAPQQAAPEPRPQGQQEPRTQGQPQRRRRRRGGRGGRPDDKE